MIGVTQLLSTREVSATGPDGTASDPFTSHQQIADSGFSDGLYYFNDGTRTRQLYFSVNGTAAGQSTGGWARYDNQIGTPYTGQECTASAGINSNGRITVQATSNGGYGSGLHGGCGVGFNNDYVKCRYFCFSDLDMDNYAQYDGTRLYAYASPTVLRSDWYGNQSGNGGYFYPGAYGFPNPASADLEFYGSNGNTTQPPTNVTSVSNSVQYHENGSTVYGFFSGVVYDFFTTEDRLFHLGQQVYQGTNTAQYLTLWFKF